MSNKGIVDLAKECATLVEKLLLSLNKLNVGDAARKRDAIRAAFKFTWKGDEIAALQGCLNEFRSQLTLSLLVSITKWMYMTPFFKCLSFLRTPSWWRGT